MSLTVTTPAQELRLTTVAAVKADLGDTTSTNDALYDSMVLRASAAIDAYCHRTFARQGYTEVLPGRGGYRLRLAEAPLAAVTSVTWDGEAIADYSIDNAKAGMLYRQFGWPWTAHLDLGLSSYGSYYPYAGQPIPGSEDRTFSIVYSAGFLLPSQDISSATVLSASSTDNSFNHSGSGFPSLMVAGDVIETSGFSTAGNNGRFRVTSATTAKVIVSGTLTTELGNTGTHVMRVSSLPRDVEGAALATAKMMFTVRSSSGGAVVEKQLGSARLRYSETSSSSASSVPPIAAALLAPYVRNA